MELSFRELKNRDVINVVDGSSLGRPCDIIIDFPRGKMTAIVVPGKKSWGIFKWFNKNELVIVEKNIVKIGSDVILVNLKCGEVCAPNTVVLGGQNAGGANKKTMPPPCPSQHPCPPSSPCPPCPPINPCPPSPYSPCAPNNPCSPCAPCPSPFPPNNCSPQNSCNNSQGHKGGTNFPSCQELFSNGSLDDFDLSDY